MVSWQKLHYKFKHTVGSRLYWIVLLFLVVWTFFPLLWALSSSFKGRFVVYETPPKVIPREPTINNYIDALYFTITTLTSGPLSVGTESPWEIAVQF